jgi:putative flippase GtrA
VHDEATAVELSRRNGGTAADIAARAPGHGQPALDVGARPPAAATASRPHIRLLHGLRKPANWVQLVQFGLVGGLGFVINLAVFALCLHAVGIDYRAAYVIAWLVAVTNNFLLNRRWTFNAHAHAGQIHFQAMRFFLVSLIAAGVGLLLLMLLVEVIGVSKVPAQALAVAASTPLNFLGNKLWSFKPQG